MSAENHLGLPEEVFELILQRLELREIFSCTCVCVGWRNAVNTNRLWEALCRKTIPQERLKAKVQSKKLPSSVGAQGSENLPELCSWRKRFIEDVGLKTNWRNGWFREDTVGDITIALHDLETDYELLLEPSLASPSFTVYNVVDSPIMTDLVSFALQQPIPEFFKLCNNVLVVVQCTLLQVYVKDDDQDLTLRFVGLFDRDHHYSKAIPDTRYLSNWYSQHVGLYPCDIYVRCDHNGKYFVGMYNNGADFSSCKLHIWDLETLTKIQEVNVPRVSAAGRMSDVTFSLHNNIIHIILELLTVGLRKHINAIHSYDIDKSCYRSKGLVVEYVIPIILFTDTMAIMTDRSGRTVFLYNLEDSLLLDTQETANPVDYRTLQLFGDLLTYVELESARPPIGAQQQAQAAVYDVKKMSPKDRFQVPNSKSIRSVHIVMDDLMIIGTSMMVLIRDVKNGVTLRTTLPYIDLLPPDPSCTKMIAQKPEGELVLLHFW